MICYYCLYRDLKKSKIPNAPSKIIYIAPMKALAGEMVAGLGERLKSIK
jgi:replicative superfamily II helicase